MKVEPRRVGNTRRSSFKTPVAEARGLAAINVASSAPASATSNVPKHGEHQFEHDGVKAVIQFAQHNGQWIAEFRFRFRCGAYQAATLPLKGALFFETARLIGELAPETFILENVEALGNHDGGKTLDTILDILTNLSYAVQTCVLNAGAFGLAQNRRRMFLVGIHARCAFSTAT